jgi:DNA replication protein DnaC
MTPHFEAKMKQIRLSGMLQALPGRLAQAQGTQMSHLDFLTLCVEDELAVRADRTFQRRVKAAGIVELKELVDFNWTFNPKLPRTRLCELVTARFVTEKTNLLLVGPPGVGKSHSVVAIALGAIRAGYRVLVKNVFVLADELADAADTNTRREVVEKLATVDLLILEDFGMKTLRATAAEDLLDVIMRRHELVSTVITTNRPTEDWGTFLQDVPAATAILDRFLQHIEIVLMQGRSYRLDHRLTPHAVELEPATDEPPAPLPRVRRRPGPQTETGAAPVPSV